MKASGQIDEIGTAFQAIHDEVRADLGERDATYIRSLIQFHRRLGALSRIVLMASALPTRVAARYDRAVGRKDPREHGDRPQRPARSVGLDERPEHPLLSTWDWDTASTLGRLEALAQLSAPHVHQRRRQGQGRRLRDHARGPQAEMGAALPSPSRSSTSC